MKSTSGWYDNGNGDNSSGFNGLPGGYCGAGGFSGITGFGYWWSSSEDNTGGAWFRFLVNINTKVGRYASDKHTGFSVRCLRD